MDNIETLISSAPNQCQMLLGNYLSILEKTNSQLSLWYNPYGIMVGILTLVVGVGAIIVGLLLWKNSKDQKERVDDFFKEQERLIKERNDREDKLTKERKEDAAKKFDELILEQQEKLEKATKNNKKVIEKVINDLKRDKASMSVSSVYSMPSGIAPDINREFGHLDIGGISKNITCIKCGKRFKYYDESSGVWHDDRPTVRLSWLPLGDKKVYCPSCGAINIL